ncbi:MAG: glycosyltransferase family 4 protein [Acidimicrobiia bacterium]
MRILFVLPGMHKVNRGAEVAFESIGRLIAEGGEHEVTLLGAGQPRDGEPYTYKHVGCVPRERFVKWPTFPGMRSHFSWEELTFAASALPRYRGRDYDLTVTCSFPYVHWLLQGRPARRRPAHVFVTQNGDWPAYANNSEYRFFKADGLICTNPEFYERNHEKWFARLIPNGVDEARFHPGEGDRAALGLPEDQQLVLMVTEVSNGKRALEGIRSVAKLKDVGMVIAGDGPQAAEAEALAAELMPGRFHRLYVPHHQMPEIYRCADAFLHMAHYEPFGIVYIEALASGLPVIAHDNVVTQWILGEHGRLVDTNDFDLVAKQLEAALEPDAAGAMEARVASARERFSLRSVAAEYQRFFEDTVAHRSGAAS